MHIDPALASATSPARGRTPPPGSVDVRPPSAPPAVRELLQRGVIERRFLFPEHGPARELVRWAPPSDATAGELADAGSYLAALERMLTPADRGELLARVLALLSHYRLEPNPPQVEMRIADDWAEDLGGYPMWAIDEAARGWRRSRRFKPQVSEMIALCDEAVETCRIERNRLRSIVERAQIDANPLARRAADVVREFLRRMPDDRADRSRP